MQMQFDQSNSSSSSNNQQKAERELRQPCACGSTLFETVDCEECHEGYCRRCLQHHECYCRAHGAALTLFCWLCKVTMCPFCDHQCRCRKKMCTQPQKLVGCQVCGEFFCPSCEFNHVCVCDCGSGLRGLSCDSCEGFYCTMCVGRRHSCLCEFCGERNATKVCASMGEIFFCPPCYEGHTCVCRCKSKLRRAEEKKQKKESEPKKQKHDAEQVVGTPLHFDGPPLDSAEMQAGRPHCRTCGRGFCLRCAGQNHDCTCGYCGEQSRSHEYCALCNRLFCAYCIRTHPCACESPDCTSGFLYTGRKFCMKCLKLFCEICFADHECSSNCSICAEPARFRCACGTAFCGKCVLIHECKVTMGKRILSEASGLAGIGEMGETSTKCAAHKDCKMTARIGTWNLNHLSATTKAVKKTLKTAALPTVVGSGQFALDVLALQEVNSTAQGDLPEHDDLGTGRNEVKVLHWGPLLQSTSPMSRLEFVRSFTWEEPKKQEDNDETEDEPKTKPKTRKRSKSKNETLNAQKDKFEEGMNKDHEQGKAFQNWSQEVTKRRKSLGSSARKADFEASEKALKENFQVGEQVFEKYGVGKFRYQEYYPLVGRKSDRLTIEQGVDLYFGDGSVKRGLQSKEAYIFRGTDEESEFRPVVVYTLTKKCEHPECRGVTFKLGVVHTSPERGTSEFNRLKIFQNQLKNVLAKFVEEGGLWVVVGDYYLTAEAIVANPASKIIHVNLRRNDPALKINFEQQIPKELEIVASASATNHPTWNPDFSEFDSVRAQVADFGLCSRAWAFKRAFPIDPENGKILAVDVGSRAFQLMRIDHTSDHSPVLIYVAKNQAQASKEVRSMLGYAEKFEIVTKLADIRRSAWKEERRKELEAQVKEAGILLAMADPGKWLEYMPFVQRYRSLLHSLLLATLPPSDLETFDFVPSTLCSDHFQRTGNQEF